MLGKIIKYELKTIGRYFLPIFIAMPVIFLISGIYFDFSPAFTNNTTSASNGNDIIEMVLILLIVASVVAIAIINLYVIITRYNNSVYGDEGYLTNTLPVKPIHIVSGKLIAFYVFQILILIVVFISLVLLIMPHLGVEAIDALKKIFFDREFYDVLYVVFNKKLGSTILYILMILISPLSDIISIMFCVAVSNLRQFSKHKALSGIAAFIVLCIIKFTVSVNIMMNSNFTVSSDSFVHKNTLESLSKSYDLFMGQTLISGGIDILIGIVLFLATVYFLERKLNIE